MCNVTYVVGFTGSGGDGRLLLNRQLSRKLVALWTSNNEEALTLFQRILPAGLLSFLESSESVPENVDEEVGEGVPNRDNLKACGFCDKFYLLKSL